VPPPNITLAPPLNSGIEQSETLFDIIYPDKMLSDVVLSSDNKTKIDQIIRDFSSWHVLVSNGIYPNRRILFFGPPGCGKTMTAVAIAAELGLPLLKVRFNMIISSNFVDTRANIKKIFDFTKGDSFVILFDNFD
jgi:SpoVK/Ycf46/Vps4 family AAA+-type ATPase